MKTAKVVGLLLALILLASPVFSGCGEEETASNTVRLGMLQTSLIASGAMYDGFIDYVRWFNEQGGADGVEVKVTMRETLMQPGEAITGFQICRDAGAVLIAVPMTGDIDAPAPLANEAKMPLLGSIPSEGMLYPPGYVWSIGPTSGQIIGTFLHWVAEEDWDWEGQGRPPKVIVWHFEAASQENYCKVGEVIADNLGITWLDPEIYPFPFPPDWTPYMMRLKQKNPDYVFGVTHELLTAEHDTGMELPPEMKLCYFYGQTFVLAGDFGERAIGCLSMQSWASPEETDVAGVVLMNQLHDQNRRSTDLTYMNFYKWGFVLSIAACEALTTAVRDEGYPVTSAAVVRALEKFDSDLMGMSGRVKFARGSRQGNTAMTLMKVDDNLESVPVTDELQTIPLEESLRALGIIE